MLMSAKAEIDVAARIAIIDNTIFFFILIILLYNSIFATKHTKHANKKSFCPLIYTDGTDIKLLFSTAGSG